MLYFCYKTSGLRFNEHRAIDLKDDLKTMKHFRPDLVDAYEYIHEDIVNLNAYASCFQKMHKVALNYHPKYQLVSGSTDYVGILAHSKEGDIASQLSLSIEIKTKALLIPFLNEDFFFIPKILKNKKIKIENKNSFLSNPDNSPFLKKSVQNRLFFPLFKEIDSLNSKLDELEKSGKAPMLYDERRRLSF